MDSQIKRRLLGPADLLREAWAVFRANFRDILIVVLFVYVPIEALLAFVPLPALRQQYGEYGLRIYNLIARLLEFLIGTVATLALALISEQWLDGKRLRWQAALRNALALWPETFLTGLLAGLIILGLGLLLIVPGVIYGLFYVFWVYVVALRGRWGKEALDYSKALVQGQWWRVFGVELTLGLLGLAVGLLITSPADLAPNALFLQGALNLATDITGAYFTVTAVLFFLNNDFVYPDVRARRQRLKSIQEWRRDLLG